MTKKLISCFVFLIVLASSQAFAHESADKCKDNSCAPPKKELCFTILCSYVKKQHEDGQFQKCRAAAKFVKEVEWDGKEVKDTSDRSRLPVYQVECDNQWIFNNSAVRYTDDLGTRIQGEPGPFPATLLPRHALREGHRYTLSSLELENQILHGHCYIYNNVE